MRQQEYNEIHDIKRDLAFFVVVLLAIFSLMVIAADAKINDCEEVAQEKSKEYTISLSYG